MQYRRLGRTDIQVSAVGFGCFALTGFYGDADDSESGATLNEALDLGVSFIDTAEGYGGGRNEELIGRAVGRRRREMVLATKFGNVRKPDGTMTAIGHPDYVIEACERSLRRLGTDVIDLYYQHRVDPATPIEDTVGAMARLVEQGKVRAIGLSEAAPETIRRAHAVHPIAALQTEYSVWSRFAEQDLIPTCRELGITYVAYSPLGRGFLAGAIRGADDLPAKDWRRTLPRLQKDHLAANLALVESIEEVARARGCTTAQVALAWLLSRGADIVPIPGTRRAAHLRANVGALDVTLTEADLAGLDRASGPDVPFGDRYPAAELKRLNL